MSEAPSVNALRDHLIAAQSSSIAQAAQMLAQTGTLPADQLAHIATQNQALSAVCAELDAHMPKLGSGSETPLP